MAAVIGVSLTASNHWYSGRADSVGDPLDDLSHPVSVTVQPVSVGDDLDADYLLCGFDPVGCCSLNRASDPKIASKLEMARNEGGWSRPSLLLE